MREHSSDLAICTAAVSNPVDLQDFAAIAKLMTHPMTDHFDDIKAFVGIFNASHNSDQRARL